VPPLLLTDDEAVAVAVGLSVSSSTGVEGVEDSSLRALHKLMQVMPARLRRRVEALQGSALRVSLHAEGPRVDPEVLAALASACHDRELMRFAYQRHDGASGRRMVEPHQLVTWGQRWYLVGWDIDRDDWRTFRVDRIGDIQPTTRRFRERQLPADDMTTYVAGNVARAGWTYQLSFRMHAPAEAVLEKINPAIGGVTPIDAGTCLLTTGTDDLWSSAVYVGLLGFDFEVEGPPELIEYMRVLAGRFARAIGSR